MPCQSIHRLTTGTGTSTGTGIGTCCGIGIGRSGTGSGSGSGTSNTTTTSGIRIVVGDEVPSQTQGVLVAREQDPPRPREGHRGHRRAPFEAGHLPTTRPQIEYSTPHTYIHTYHTYIW